MTHFFEPAAPARPAFEGAFLRARSASKAGFRRRIPSSPQRQQGRLSKAHSFEPAAPARPAFEPAAPARAALLALRARRHATTSVAAAIDPSLPPLHPPLQ